MRWFHVARTWPGEESNRAARQNMAPICCSNIVSSQKDIKQQLVAHQHLPSSGAKKQTENIVERRLGTIVALKQGTYLHIYSSQTLPNRTMLFSAHAHPRNTILQSHHNLTKQS